MSALTPLQQYQADLNRPDFHYDAAQQRAVEALQGLYDELTTKANSDHWIVQKARKWFGKKQQSVKGLYFWGGVGRGKTYLVDTFYHALPTERKLRAHFHRFMYRIHHELDQRKGESDPLPKIAADLAEQYQVICFDEFFVSDITDAMILATLFEALFANGVVLVATSNIVPDDLYRNGLQRARFLPCIELIKRHCQVMELDSGIDYRLRTLEQAEIYHWPLDQQAEQQLLQYFSQLAPEQGKENTPILIEGREIQTIRQADGVLLVDFTALCDGPRSQRDYMELARIYHTVLLANVTPMGPAYGGDDIARRFLALVDEFYDRNVKLIISAQVAAEELYPSGGLEFEFRRCLSRLTEMQSHEYLAQPHVP
ncbi:cell division protein ZapE [Paraferrimonas sedimenticola]|uniref:Cell division protein ZapE n=1 Tax=Paraferrimonas sedimenticola TaxID=375674 RepID=A0AA37RV50_9GAMM|nr:cell division protein ZapE [Paraferrimonas sedimenticola]GLP95813.1 cell division protein ZapE [Paraferrimonas sedimenticola]